MSPNSLLPLLFLFLFLSFSSSSVEGDLKAITTDIPDCPSYDCGNGERVVYPFWVQDRSANSTSTLCGYPNFKLTCEDDKPSLTTISDSYTVSSINTTTKTLKLVDSDVAGQSCPRARHNVSLQVLSSAKANSTTNRSFALAPSATNLVFCFNSSIPIGDRLPMLDGLPAFPIDCLNSTPGSSSHVFDEANVDEDELYAYLYGKCQSGVVISPVNEDDIKGKNLSTYFAEAMNNGFEVTWDELGSWRTSDCVTCERAGGRCGYTNRALEGSQFRCFCRNGVHPSGDCSNGHRSKNKELKIGLGISGLGLLVILLYVTVVWWCKCRPSLSDENSVGSLDDCSLPVQLFPNGQPLALAAKRYTHVEVKRMTADFKEKLGQGGYGTVYKGKLLDGSLVAVKMLKETEGSGEEFTNEVRSIGGTNHINVVTLLGFCSERSKRALIYEFMPNGSLDRFLFSADAKLKSFLDWEKMQEIAIGIARGLEYLHKGCKTSMVHFDIKPHNILLDKDLCPKISDFGLAKFCRPKESVLSTICARGTIGYIAPEVFSRSFGRVSDKSDVYSYGMVVLEMVGRRRNVAGGQNTSDVYFPHWIHEHLDEYCNSLRETCADSSVEGENPEIARKLALVGLWCIQTSPNSRPSISKVVEMLNGDAGNLDIPPKPYICSPDRSGCDSEEIHTFASST